MKFDYHKASPDGTLVELEETADGATVPHTVTGFDPRKDYGELYLDGTFRRVVITTTQQYQDATIGRHVA